MIISASHKCRVVVEIDHILIISHSSDDSTYGTETGSGGAESAVMSSETSG